MASSNNKFNDDEPPLESILDSRKKQKVLLADEFLIDLLEDHDTACYVDSMVQHSAVLKGSYVGSQSYAPPS